MDNNKIEVDRNLLIELKTGIVEAICSEDGLDGGDGVYLLAHLNGLLGLPVSDYRIEDVESDWPEYVKTAHQRYRDQF